MADLLRDFFSSFRFKCAQDLFPSAIFLPFLFWPNEPTACDSSPVKTPTEKREKSFSSFRSRAGREFCFNYVDQDRFCPETHHFPFFLQGVKNTNFMQLQQCLFPPAAAVNMGGGGRRQMNFKPRLLRSPRGEKHMQPSPQFPNYWRKKIPPFKECDEDKRGGNVEGEFWASILR